MSVIRHHHAGLIRDPTHSTIWIHVRTWHQVASHKWQVACLMMIHLFQPQLVHVIHLSMVGVLLECMHNSMGIAELAVHQESLLQLFTMLVQLCVCTILLTLGQQIL